MTEEHVMEVKWSGEAVLAERMASAIVEHGHKPEIDACDGVTNLRLVLSDNDLQSLRDRVDALLVVLSAIEDAHGE